MRKVTKGNVTIKVFQVFLVIWEMKLTQLLLKKAIVMLLLTFETRILCDVFSADLGYRRATKVQEHVGALLPRS